MATLVLGIGNLILRDDGVGIRIARKLKEANPELEVIETSEAGLTLLDLVVGYDRLIIIDSIKTGKGKTGEVYQLTLEDLKPSKDFSSSHGIDIATAFELGLRLSYNMPDYVRIYAVEIKDNTIFGEECSPEIEERIPLIARQIARKEKLGRTLKTKKARAGFGI